MLICFLDLPSQTGVGPNNHRTVDLPTKLLRWDLLLPFVKSEMILMIIIANIIYYVTAGPFPFSKERLMFLFF